MSLKYRVLSRLLNNEKPRDIVATEEGTTYATVIRWQRELEKSRENNTVAKLMEVDQAVFEEVLANIEAHAPAVIEGEVQEATQELRRSISAADALQTDLLQTASHLNVRVRSLAMCADSVGDLSMLADTLCALQNAFFNKSTTNVQINNHNTEAPKYGEFLSD